MRPVRPQLVSYFVLPVVAPLLAVWPGRLAVDVPHLMVVRVDPTWPPPLLILLVPFLQY